MPSDALDDRLSRPAPEDAAALAALDGDLVVLGASGKMGPTMARLARRAAAATGAPRRVIGVARFSDRGCRDRLEEAGVETVACDLLDREAVARLPDAALVLFLAGQKFGTAADPAATWATNVLAAVHAADRYREARFAAFSTGNVYPLTPVDDGGATEDTPPAPVGEYAQSALARERLLTHLSRRHGTPLAVLRLNYAIEPRYGVLRDVADRVWQGEPIDLTMGYVNVIGQRDACGIALRTLAHATTPPLVLNVTGPDTVSIRRLAYLFAERFDREPEFTGTEAPTALLSDASKMVELFGPPATTLEELVDEVADWVRGGGTSLGRPTRYDVRDGAF